MIGVDGIRRVGTHAMGATNMAAEGVSDGASDGVSEGVSESAETGVATGAATEAAAAREAFEIVCIK